MAKQTIKINSILNGQSPTTHFGGDGQYLDSVGIDPSAPLASMGYSKKRAGGLVTPVYYATFSGENVTGSPMWLLTSNKDNALDYAYMNDGKFVSYSATKTETLIGTPTSGAGNGAAYYNNYYYLATPTQIFRYGPLNGTPALSNALIANSELLDGWDGGSDTLLTNTTYPTSGANTLYPNHAMHMHSDGALYICDYKDGQGLIHKIKTTKSSVEGDTSDGSQYNVLDLPFGYLPTDIESWGNDLVISAIQTTDNSLNQGKSAIFFWDTYSDSFYVQVDIPEVYTTALLNNAGTLNVFCGSPTKMTLRLYNGGISTVPVFYSEETYSPLAGAVEAVGNRVMWGGRTTTPSVSASVFARGYESPILPSTAVNNIIQTDATTSGVSIGVTALKLYLTSTNQTQYNVGWASSNKQGIAGISGASAKNNKIRFPIQQIGRDFQIRKISIPLSERVGATTTIKARVYLDDEGTLKTLTEINATNFPNSERVVDLYPDIDGTSNFYLELLFEGTQEISVGFPITIDVEILD